MRKGEKKKTPVSKPGNTDAVVDEGLFPLAEPGNTDAVVDVGLFIQLIGRLKVGL